MATTVTLANAPTVATDVAVKQFDQTKFLLRRNDMLPNGTQSEYVYSDGDPTTETTVLVRQTYDAKNGIVGTSIRLKTVQIVEVDGEETERASVDIVLAWNTPGPMEDAGLVLDLIGSVYGLAFDGVTSKVPNEGTINALNRGLTGALFG